VADLAWARAVLAERGLRPTARPVQVRTWNLSSLWRVPVEGQTVWLKVVPHFFAHEGDLLALMAGARVPTLLGHEGGRMLLAEIAGEDLYAAELPLLKEMVNLLVGLQLLWGNRVEELLALGLPDWRAPALRAAIAGVVDRTRDEISAEDRATLADFVRGLPQLCQVCQIPMLFTEPGDPTTICQRESEFKGEKFQTCSNGCQWIFEREPEKYVQAWLPVHQIYQGSCGGPTLPDVLEWYGIQEGDSGEHLGSVDDKNWQRWHAGERIAAEDYLRRYPALETEPGQALELIYGEFLVREDLGETPAPEEFLRRFPDVEKELRAFIDNRHYFGRAAAELDKELAPDDMPTTGANIQPDSSIEGRKKKNDICIACCCVLASVDKNSPSARLAAMNMNESA
jgi:hypothetical protein